MRVAFNDEVGLPAGRQALGNTAFNSAKILPGSANSAKQIKVRVIVARQTTAKNEEIELLFRQCAAILGAMKIRNGPYREVWSHACDSSVISVSATPNCSLISAATVGRSLYLLSGDGEKLWAKIGELDHEG